MNTSPLVERFDRADYERRYWYLKAPLVPVVRSVLMAEGPATSMRRAVHTFRRDTLACGHTVEVGWGRSLKPVKRRHCDACFKMGALPPVADKT